MTGFPGATRSSASRGEGESSTAVLIFQLTIQLPRGARAMVRASAWSTMAMDGSGVSKSNGTPPSAPTWRCASLKPGTTTRPPSSMTRVCGRTSARIESSSPTISTRSPAIASAVAHGCALSAVKTLPPSRIRSAARSRGGTPEAGFGASAASARAAATHAVATVPPGTTMPAKSASRSNRSPRRPGLGARRDIVVDVIEDADLLVHFPAPRRVPGPARGGYCASPAWDSTASVLLWQRQEPGRIVTADLELQGLLAVVAAGHVHLDDLGFLQRRYEALVVLDEHRGLAGLGQVGLPGFALAVEAHRDVAFVLAHEALAAVRREQVHALAPLHVPAQHQPHAVRAGGGGVDARGVLHAIHVRGLVIPEVREAFVLGLGFRVRLDLRQGFLHFRSRWRSGVLLEDFLAHRRRQRLAVFGQHLLVELQLLVGGGFVRGGQCGGGRRSGWRRRLLRAGAEQASHEKDGERRGERAGRRDHPGSVPVAPPGCLPRFVPAQRAVFFRGPLSHACLG